MKADRLNSPRPIITEWRSRSMNAPWPP